MFLDAYTTGSAGLTVAQISEFSLIVAALGLSLGHLSAEIMGLITLVGVVTIFVSTYMILYSGPLYRFLAEPLKLFERRHPYREMAIDATQEPSTVDVILVGLGNYGSGIAEKLLQQNKTLIGVDFDPAHFVMTRRPVTEALRTLHDRILHVQLRDAHAGNDGAQEQPVGQGTVDWIEVLELLGEMDYRGWLTAIRTQGIDPARDLTRGIKWIQRILLGG